MAGLRRLVLEGGEGLTLLIGDDGLLDPHIAHYTLSRPRPSGIKAATIEKALQSLLVFRLYCPNRLRGSLRDSSMIAGRHEQVGPRVIQDHELVVLQ